MLIVNIGDLIYLEEIELKNLVRKLGIFEFLIIKEGINFFYEYYVGKV